MHRPITMQKKTHIKKGDMVTELRKRAKLPLESLLDDTRGKVERALNRELTKGVLLTGQVRTGRLVDVIAAPRWLVVRANQGFVRKYQRV